MTLGLYKVGKNQPIIRLRRGRNNARGKLVHAVPGIPRTALPPLCDAQRPTQSWQWTEDDITCPRCLDRVRAGSEDGTLVLADPFDVAELQRRMLMSLGNRQAEAADRLAVEINRPRGSVVGSPSTRRVIHLTDCPVVSSLAGDVRIVQLPVSEVRRQYNADGRQTDFCQECKPFHVFDNDRRRPHSLDEARAVSTREGYIARERYRRTARNPHRSYAFRTLPHDGSKHFEDCPAGVDELVHGDVTEPDYGRCKCYARYGTARPGEQHDDDFSPEWTL
jgi:hypothetical protein